MKPRPLYRWKTFWLGLFIIAFLCWTWAISMKRHTIIQVHSPTGWIGIGQHQGEAGLFAKKINGRWSTNVTDIRMDANIHGLPEMWKFYNTYFSVLRTSHFWLIITFTLPWAAFLTWRMRRMDHLPA